MGDTSCLVLPGGERWLPWERGGGGTRSVLTDSVTY